MSRTITAVDLFCGAGGASTGFARACEQLGVQYDLTAINHWNVAIDTHSANHPSVRHLCMSVEHVEPRQAVPSGRLHLLMAGPECTHFSTARGGRPVNPQSRASAWHILKWAQELYIDTILIENVPEFRTWGPIGTNGKPLKSAKGHTYRAFLEALRSLGYKVEDRILNAADYGDPTTRQRLFIMARRGRHRLTWPAPTHSKTGAATLFGKTKRWKAARDVIDWGIKGKSIFHRKKPLRPATIARILAGLKKFGGSELRPFLIMMEHGGRVGSVDVPLPTITTAKGGAIGVAQPFLVQFKGTADDQLRATARSVDEPVGTITAGGGNFGVAEPMLLHTTHGGRERSVNDPLPTVTAAHRGELALIEPFVLPQHGGAISRPVDRPMPTITTDGAIGVVEPYLAKYYGSGDGVSPVSDPTPTVTTRDRFALVEPFILQPGHSGSDECRIKSVDDPLGTLPCSNRFALIQPIIDGYVLDIHFRMLQPHELAAATSFPKSYVFKGSREDVVKQIGNAWPGEIAKALCVSAVEDYAAPRREWRSEATA